MITFDHFAIACQDLDVASAALEAQLGAPLSPVGHHEAFGTHNKVFGLGPDEYLELIAVDPAAPPPNRPRWFALDRFDGPVRITNWIVRTDDIGATLATLGPEFGTPVDLQRGPFRWQMAVPSDGELPFGGTAPALIEWQGTAHPAKTLPDVGLRLTNLTLQHPEAETLKSLMAPVMADARVTYATGPLSIQATLSGPGGDVVL